MMVLSCNFKHIFHDLTATKIFIEFTQGVITTLPDSPDFIASNPFSNSSSFILCVITGDGSNFPDEISLDVVIHVSQIFLPYTPRTVISFITKSFDRSILTSFVGNPRMEALPVGLNALRPWLR